GSSLHRKDSPGSREPGSAVIEGSETPMTAPERAGSHRSMRARPGIPPLRRPGWAHTRGTRAREEQETEEGEQAGLVGGHGFSGRGLRDVPEASTLRRIELEGDERFEIGAQQKTPPLAKRGSLRSCVLAKPLLCDESVQAGSFPSSGRLTVGSIEADL